MMPTFLVRSGLFVLLLTAFAGPASAIVTATGSDGSAPVPALDFGGVARLGNGCSGALLAGGQYVLASAHCAGSTGSTVSFANGASATITAVAFAPGWTGTVAVNDLAIMSLASAPAGVTGYAPATPLTGLGQTVVLAGFGLGGSGATGGTVGAGTLRFGYNQYEVLLADAPTTSYGGNVVAFDFDDGTAVFNRFGTRGLGANEAMLAGLDSGGPSFFFQGGAWRIAGIHAAINSNLGTTFGGEGFDMLVGNYLPWIESVTAVPEPATWTMLLAGLGFAAWCGKRRAVIAGA